MSYSRRDNLQNNKSIPTAFLLLALGGSLDGDVSAVFGAGVLVGRGIVCFLLLSSLDSVRLNIMESTAYDSAFIYLDSIIFTTFSATLLNTYSTL